MNKIIGNQLIERYERFIGLQNEMYEVYRYRHAIVRNDVTQWVEATDRLSHILWKMKERWIERPELIEKVQEHNIDTGVKYDY